MYTLKPCPFCGRQVDANDEDTVYPTGSWWVERDGQREYHPYSLLHAGIPKTQWCYGVNCVKSSGGCGVRVSGDTEEEAVNNWNRRVSENTVLHRLVTSIIQLSYVQHCLYIAAKSVVPQEPYVGSYVSVMFTRHKAPIVSRYGMLLSKEWEPTPEQDDPQFRGPDWKPTTQLVYTILGADGKEYRWTNVQLYPAYPLVEVMI